MGRFPTESIFTKASFDPFGTFANISSRSSFTMERSDQADRKVSFNPEAAAFSPITTAAEQAENVTQGPGSAERGSSGFGMAAVPHDSPFGSKGKMCAAEVGESSASGQDRLQLQDLLDKGIPLGSLMSSLQDTSTRPAQGTAFPSFHEQAHFQHASNPAMFNSYQQQYRPESNFTVPDVDELSASLGLPGAKKIPTVEASPARSRTSVGSQQKIPSGDFYSKLLTRAQGTPLTADSLAHMLKGGSDSSEETVRASRAQQDPFVEHGSPAHELGQTIKVVRAPPGFGNQRPRMVAVEEEQMMPSSSSRMLPNLQQTAQPSCHQHYGPSIGQSSAPFQQHPHRSSNSRRPRGYTRPKRTDQGPEPSAADIYPDDAHWTPSEPIHRQYFAPPPYPPPQQQHQQQLRLQEQNATSWPTLAEVHMQNSQPAAVAHSRQKFPAQPQPFNVFECHVAPSEADKSASDEVLTLLDQLPEPTIDTLLHFGAMDLLAEDRPLTPLQTTGSRYGLEFGGMGFGDPWRPAVVTTGRGWDNPEPFRVRPRDHEGWGGWEWGMTTGWGGGE